MRIVQGVLQRGAVDAGIMMVVQQALGPRPRAPMMGALTMTMSVTHRETVGAAAGRASDPLALQAVFTGDAVTLTRALVVVVLDRAHVILDVRANGALGLHHLVHQDLLHLPVVEVVKVPHRVLGPGDQVQEDRPGWDPGHELMLTQPLRGRPLKRILLKTRVHKMPEDVTPGGVRKARSLILRDVVESAHGVHVEVRGLPLCELDAGDAEGPDVDLAVVLTLVHGEDDLRRHPVRCSHKTVGWARNSSRSEIRKFDVASVSQQDVTSLDVPEKLKTYNETYLMNLKIVRAGWIVTCSHNKEFNSVLLLDSVFVITARLSTSGHF